MCMYAHITDMDTNTSSSSTITIKSFLEFDWYLNFLMAKHSVVSIFCSIYLLNLTQEQHWKREWPKWCCNSCSCSYWGKVMFHSVFFHSEFMSEKPSEPSGKSNHNTTFHSFLPDVTTWALRLLKVISWLYLNYSSVHFFYLVWSFWHNLAGK